MSRSNSHAGRKGQEGQEGDWDTACAVVRAILGGIGNRWSLLVLVELFDEPRRFRELERAIPGVSRRMLARTLRILERDGLVSRTVHPTAPPQVEYAVTRLGRDLEGPLLGVVEWAEGRAEDVLKAQREYDEQER